MSERDAHPDEGTIHAWLDRQLDDRASDALEAHLQRCDECAERVAEARGLIAGTSRILSSLDVDALPDSGTPAVEPWRPVVVTPAPKRSVPLFRLTPARSAIAAVLVVAVATAIVREHERTGATRASSASESAVIANAPAVAPVAGASAGSVPAVSSPVAGGTTAVTSAPPAVAQLDTTAGTRVATARTFAKTQRETTVNADLARVAAVPPPTAASPAQQAIAAAKVADSVAGAANRVELRGAVSGAPMAGSGVAAGVAGGVSRVPAPAPAAAPTSVGIEAPQCYRVESATGAAATWGPVALPFVLALDAPATSSAARVLTPAGKDAEARAVFERRGGDSLLFTLRRIGYTGTLAVGAPGEVRAGVMRSTPSATLLESTIVTAAPIAGERRALRKPSAAQARADSAAAPPERDASPAVPVVVRKVGCH
jgi:anti-sigma factor RsiW